MKRSRAQFAWLAAALAFPVFCAGLMISNAALAGDGSQDDDEWGDWEGWEEESQYDTDVPAEHEYSLQRCIAITIKQNRAIEAANWEVEFYDARGEEAWWAWWPSIRIRSVLTAAPDHNPPSMDDPEAWLKYKGAAWYEFDGVLWGAKAEVIAPLYTFGKISSIRQMGEVAGDAAREGRKVMVGKMIYEVKRAYYTLQFLEKMLAVLDEGVGYIESAEKKLEELLKQGSENVTDIDRYKFAVVKADLMMRIEEVKRGRDIVEMALKALMNLRPDAPLFLDQRYLQPHDPVQPYLAKQFVTETMLLQQPALKLLDHQLTVAQKQRRQQWAYYFPDFFLALQYEYQVAPEMVDYDQPFLSNPYNKHYIAGVLGLSYTFDLPLQMARMRQADARLKRMEAEKAAYRQKAQLELDSAWRTYQEKIKQVDINLDGKKAGRKWMITSMMNYNIGLLESGRMVEAIAAYFKTQFNYFSAIYQMRMAQVDLEHSMGLTAQVEQSLDADAATPASAPAQSAGEPQAATHEEDDAR